jgi:acyl-CoA thioesterase-1
MQGEQRVISPAVVRYSACRPSACVLALLALGIAAWGCGASEPAPQAATPAAATNPAVTATDSAFTDSGVTDSAVAGSAITSPAVANSAPVVLFLGTSLTAGYGLPSGEAFAARIQQRIDATALDFRVVNAGVSGDTSAGGLARLDWLLRLPIAALVLELGANDMLRGLSVDAMRANLAAILEQTRRAQPGVRFVIAGMQAAPNLGLDYAQRFNDVFPKLARAHDAELIPFLLDGIAGERQLNQADGIHPTAEGHERIAETVWRTLEPVLREIH